MDKKMEYKVIERSLPGRINTRLIKDWDKEHGTLCTGCNTVLNSWLGPCECTKRERKK